MHKWMEACSFFPSPLSLAKMTGNKDFLDSIFQFSTPVNEDLLLWAEIQNIDQTKVSERHGSELDTTKVAKPPNRYEFQCSNSVNLFCGGVGTTKNIRATHNSQLDRLSWTSEMPGDLHTGTFLESSQVKSSLFYYASSTNIHKIDLTNILQNTYAICLSHSYTGFA